MKENKKIIFITTKNIDYIRNIQEINMLEKEYKDVKIIYSKSKIYLFRILKVILKVAVTNFKEVKNIFVGFSPQLILPIFKRKFKNKNVTIDFFISLYDTFVNDRKRIKNNTIISKLLKMIDKRTLELADKIIVDTKEDFKYFEKEFGVKNKQWEVLYLEANTKIYNENIEPIKDNRLNNKYVVLYFGTILPLQGIDIVVDAAEKLENYENIIFVIIGPKGKIKEYSKNVVYIEWLEQTVLAQYIAKADLCLAGHFSADINKAKRTIAGKSYIYEKMNKKMILGDNSANKEQFKEGENYYFVEMGNSEKLKEKILEIFEKEEQER